MRAKVVLSICLLLPIAGPAQTELEMRLAQKLATLFLLDITNPAGTDYRVGIINVGSNTGMMLSPQGEVPVVAFFQSESKWLWRQFDQQLKVPDRDDLRLKLVRKTLDDTSCPGLERVHSSFYLALEGALSDELSLTTLPVRVEVESVAVDGTIFPIQLHTASNHLLLRAERDGNTGLHQAALFLHSIVSGCANAVEGDIQVIRYQ